MTVTYELRIERIIDAPPAIVWRAWTDHFAEWFVPRPWTVKVLEHDLRAGGRAALVMRGPDGEEHLSEGVILEVVSHERIVSTDAFGHGWVPQQPFMVRIDAFEDAGEGRTRYVAIARHWTAEARDEHREMGFEAGWNAAADQLVEVVTRIATE